MTLFEERLWPSTSWWLITLLAGLGVGVVFVPVLAPGFVLAAMLLTVALLAFMLIGYAAVIRVDDEGLRAGRALLPWEALGAVAILDAAEARVVRGPRADPRAYMLLRAYVPGAITVRVVDAADPTPYWFISTREPGALSAALALGQSGKESGARGPG